MENRPGAFLSYLMAVSLALFGIAKAKRFGSYTSEDFFQPQAVAHLAAQLPNGTEDDFILDAWEMVGQGIPYENIGSHIYFDDLEIECADCYLPLEVVAREKGNCVGKSALLVSILANRISAERLRIMMGQYYGAGHAWVEVKRGSEWYLLEATRGPKDPPWILAESTYPTYDPGVLLQPGYIECADPDYCRALASCNCGLDKIRMRG